MSSHKGSLKSQLTARSAQKESLFLSALSFDQTCLMHSIACGCVEFCMDGANPPRPGGFPGANSPGPVTDLYGPSSQDSAVGNYISAASPQPGSGFNHSIA
ncbi:hypothetical protein cypCar_00017995, partial [Cyprinus carpio]